MPPQEQAQNESSPTIRHAKVDSLIIYEVTESELESLEKGSPNSSYLNLSIAFLALSFSFLASVLTTKIESDRIFTIFIVIIFLGFFIGISFLIVWFKANSSVVSVSKKIKDRLKSTNFLEDNRKLVQLTPDETSTLIYPIDRELLKKN